MSKINNPQNSNCPSDEILAAYLAGSLQGEEHFSVMDHLGKCPTCYQVFVEVARDEAGARRQARVRFYGAAAGLAAAVVLAVLGMHFMLDRSMPGPAPGDRSTSAYWIEKFGVVSPADPRVANSRKVFLRMVRASDRGEGAQPGLLVVRETGTPYALSLKDSTIVLSADTLQLCYEGVTDEQGNARLAFVLGHELVHQKDQHHFHAAAFAAIEEAEASIPVSREKELQADAYGLIYATIAGYDPRAVLTGNTDFIRQWTSQLPQRMAYAENGHPGPEERAEYLRSHLQEVANDLDYFHFGVRLYQLGRYEDAIALLSRFAEKFPAREVWNNLGLCHYQLAMQTLTACDPSYLLQFYPATILDTRTLARQLRSATGGSCLERNAFRDEIQQADRSFRRAVDMDPSYVPARVNLSSVLIVTQQYATADELLKQALQLNPEDPAARNNQALTNYLSDPSQMESSLAVLRSVIATAPEFAPARYNMAMLQSKSGTTDQANQSRKRFLNLESHGLYADAVRDALSIRSPTAESYPAMTSPIPLGDRSRLANELLAKMKETPFSLNNLTGAFYQNDSYRVLVLDDFIEVVESTAFTVLDPEKLQSKYGTPIRILSTPRGSVELYADFALDIQDGRVVNILHFER